jgi:hypothetical protein
MQLSSFPELESLDFVQEEEEEVNVAYSVHSLVPRGICEVVSGVI